MTFNLQVYQRVWNELNDRNAMGEARALRRIALPKEHHALSPIPLHIFPTIPSTNQKLWELIDDGATIPLVAIAMQQTAGRGQWSKTWVSSEGGLYLSIAIAPNLAPDHNPHLLMATAWGIATLLRSYQLPVSLKWPNDLILARRKLGGIKIETRIFQRQVTHAVIGVGINWINPVPEVGINLQSYQQEQIPSLEQLAAITAYGILSGYQHYLSVGIEQLLDDYLEILTSLGQTAMVNSCPGEVTGVTTDGKLKVRLRSPGATTEVCLSPGQISLGY